MGNTGWAAKAVAMLMALGAPAAAEGPQVDAATALMPVVAAPEVGREAASGEKLPPRDPTRGSVTNLPLPRYVSLKTNEGNARRGPGLTHRIDWVFTRAGMPLRVTGEFEHWRRVEDAEGVGGWVHYSLLSGARTALVTQDMAEFRTLPNRNAAVAFQAEMGVVGRIAKCDAGWCRVTVEGQRGWVESGALWGVGPNESVD